MSRAARPPVCRERGDLCEAMHLAFVRSGGISTSEEFIDLLRCRLDQPISTLARWIVGRSVVNLQWRYRLHVPLFQIDLRAMTIRPEAAAVLAELTGVFDDWEIACWFAQPNSWLDGRCPAALIVARPAEVLMAARADRFVARG